MRRFTCPACKSEDIGIKFYEKDKEWKGNNPSAFTKISYEGYYVTKVQESYFYCVCQRCENIFREALNIEEDKS